MTVFEMFWGRVSSSRLLCTVKMVGCAKPAQRPKNGPALLPARSTKAFLLSSNYAQDLERSAVPTLPRLVGVEHDSCTVSLASRSNSIYCFGLSSFTRMRSYLETARGRARYHLPRRPKNSLQEKADLAKSAAATGLASKQGGNGKGLIGGKLAREVVVQLFKKWVRSDDRTKVKPFFRIKKLRTYE